MRIRPPVFKYTLAPSVRSCPQQETSHLQLEKTLTPLISLHVQHRARDPLSHLHRVRRRCRSRDVPSAPLRSLGRNVRKVADNELLSSKPLAPSPEMT